MELSQAINYLESLLINDGQLSDGQYINLLNAVSNVEIALVNSGKRIYWNFTPIIKSMKNLSGVKLNEKFLLIKQGIYSLRQSIKNNLTGDNYDQLSKNLTDSLLVEKEFLRNKLINEKFISNQEKKELAETVVLIDKVVNESEKTPLPVIVSPDAAQSKPKTKILPIALTIAAAVLFS